jgi:hypothetical protein
MLRPRLIEPPEVKEIKLQELNRQLKESGPLLPGPTIAQAQAAQYGSLVAECAHCNPHRARPLRINPTPARNTNRGPPTGPHLHALDDDPLPAHIEI